jgi:hypothetical protein
MPSLIDYLEKVAFKNDLMVNNTSQGGMYRTRFYLDQKFEGRDEKGITTAEVGESAKKFSTVANEKYQQGKITYPYSKEKIAEVIELFKEFDKDVKGDPNGSLEEQKRAQEWEAFWKKVANEKNITDPKFLRQMQEDVLSSYRYRAFSLAKVEPRFGDPDAKKAHESMTDMLKTVDKYYLKGRLESGAEPTLDYMYNNIAKSFDGHKESAQLYQKSLVTSLNDGDENKSVENIDQLISDKSNKILRIPSVKTATFNDIVKDLSAPGNERALQNFVKFLPTIVKKVPITKDFLAEVSPENKAVILNQAVKSGNKESVDHLIKAGADLDNKSTNYTRSPLQALKDGFKGFPKNFPKQLTQIFNKPERTPLEIAKLGGDKEIVSTLQKASETQAKQDTTIDPTLVVELEKTLEKSRGVNSTPKKSGPDSLHTVFTKFSRSQSDTKTKVEVNEAKPFQSELNEIDKRLKDLENSYDFKAPERTASKELVTNEHKLLTDVKSELAKDPVNKEEVVKIIEEGFKKFAEDSKYDILRGLPSSTNLLLRDLQDRIESPKVGMKSGGK